MSSLINFLLTNYIYPLTSYFFLFMLGFGSQVISLIILFFFKEELDVKHLAKYGGVMEV